MSWLQVFIPSSDVAKVSAEVLLNRIGQEFRAAGCPNGARVLHVKSDASDHIYFFSPVLSGIATKAAKESQLSASQCSEPKDLQGVREITL